GRAVDAIHFQPLVHELSGVDLEYHVIQLYCRDRGERNGTLQIKLADKAAEMPLHIIAKPATKVTFQVREVDGTPCMGCFEIRDERNRVYPSMAKRLAPDFLFHPQIYRESCENIPLPPGKFTVRC